MMEHGSISTLKKKMKEKKKEQNNDDDVQILFVSTPPSRFQAPTFKPSSELIKIVCNEHEFILPLNVAKRCGFISRLFNDDNGFKENQNQSKEVVLHENFDSECLEEVFRFCALDCKINPQGDSSLGSYSQSSNDRFIFVFELNPQTVLGTLHAAHFLSVAPLVHSATHYIANKMGNEVELLEGLSEDVLTEIFSVMDPRKLAKIEQEIINQNVKLQIENDILQRVWKKKCENRGWIVTYEDTVDWKSVFFGQDLQEKLIFYNVDLPILLDHLTDVGPDITKHNAHHHNTIKWWTYLHFLTGLKELDLSYNLITEDEMKILVDLLPKFSKLSKLVLSDCGIDENSVVLLSSYFLSLSAMHPHAILSSIDLTWNSLSQNSADILANALFISVPDCKIFLHFNYTNRKFGEKQEYNKLLNPQRGDLDLLALRKKYPQIQNPHTQ